MDIPSIRRDISRKTLRAVQIAGDDLKGIMDECMDVYYGEYSPRLYNRTNIFRDSPEKGAAVSVGLGATGSTIVLTPFPFAYGTLCLGANTILSPITAFFSKGEHITIPAGSDFRIKLLEEVMIN